VTIRCDNVYATAEALKSRGVKLAVEPKKEVWGAMAKFRDPPGKEFVFSSKQLKIPTGGRVWLRP